MCNFIVTEPLDRDYYKIREIERLRKDFHLTNAESD